MTDDYHQPDTFDLQAIDQVCDEFERAWIAGEVPRIEDYLGRVGKWERVPLLKELLCTEIEYRRRRGERPAADLYIRRFKDHTALIDQVLRRTETSPSPTIQGTDDVPEQIGRYRVERLLGAGAFGRVYLARDPDLDRRVAIKVPRSDRSHTNDDLDLFLHEARIAAQLKHPGLVAVHDVQRDGDSVYVVQEYVDGKQLDAWSLAASRPLDDVVRVMIEVAQALGFAHARHLVHRDIKPANILVDPVGHAHVTDFGLALQEDAVRASRDVAGTPAYMSPEQIQGEAKRLDGRSDIWSMGVILYELLTGRLPFRGDDRDQLFSDITDRDPRPPRQIRPDVPRELERICLTCLHKRAADRYVSGDLVHALKSVLEFGHLAGEAKRSPDSLTSFHAALDMLLPYLADRQEHEHRIREALMQLEAPERPNILCCIVHGDENQCHDTFAERLKETTLRTHFGLPADEPVKRHHLLVPHDVHSRQEFDERLRMQLAEQLRLGQPAGMEQIAGAIAAAPWPMLTYSELPTVGNGDTRKRLLNYFLEFWEELPIQVIRRPLTVCLGVVYRSRTSRVRRWFKQRSNHQVRRYLGSLDLSSYSGLHGVVLPELRNLTLDDADNWLQTMVGDFRLRQELRPRIRSIFAQMSEISMEHWRDALRSAVEALVSRSSA